MQTFYDRVTQPLRSTIDATVGGNLVNETEDEAYNLTEEMALNNFQQSFERTQPKQVRSKLELDTISMLSYKVVAMSQKLERLNVNSVSSSTPSPSCDICGLVEHLIVYCHVGSPFTEDVTEQVNYVNNYHPKLTNDPLSSTYNPGQRNHPNISYNSNAPLVP